jgi:hypothetical protein
MLCSALSFFTFIFCHFILSMAVPFSSPRLIALQSCLHALFCSAVYLLPNDTTLPPPRSASTDRRIFKFWGTPVEKKKGSMKAL